MAADPRSSRLVAIFAENVRAERVRRDFSQEELAERAGVHRTYVGMVERCEKNVTIYNIERFARALGVTPAFLLTPKSTKGMSRS